MLSPNFVAALHRLRPEEYTSRPELFGKIVETYIWQRFSQEYRQVSFWRKGPREIDFLVQKADNALVPIEVKFPGRGRNEDLAGLVGFREEKRINAAVVLTRDIAQTRTIGGIRVRLVPFYVL